MLTSGKEVTEGSLIFFTLQGFSCSVDSIMPEIKAVTGGLSTALHSGLFSWENTRSAREQRSQEAYPLTLYLKTLSLGWAKLFWTKRSCPRFSSVPGIHKASPSVNLPVPREVWPAAESPTALGNSPMASLEVNPHVLTEVCLLEKGFLTFSAVLGFPSAQLLLPNTPPSVEPSSRRFFP